MHYVIEALTVDGDLLPVNRTGEKWQGIRDYLYVIMWCKTAVSVMLRPLSLLSWFWGGKQAHWGTWGSQDLQAASTGRGQPPADFQQEAETQSYSFKELPPTTWVGLEVDPSPVEFQMKAQPSWHVDWGLWDPEERTKLNLTQTQTQSMCCFKSLCLGTLVLICSR